MAKSKRFEPGADVEIIADATSFLAPNLWESAEYIKAGNNPGWHWARLRVDGQQVFVPARRIRAAKARP